jgi:hypothetical protein
MSEASLVSVQDKQLREVATAKYVEATDTPHGRLTGRRLAMASNGLTQQMLELMVIDQLVDTGRRLGVEFLQNTPAISRNDDTAGMIKSLINSFMVAYLTPETTDQAFDHLVGLESLRGAVADSRGLSRRPPTPDVKH